MKASANSMETPIKTAMVAALLVFVGVLVFMFMVPVPSLDKAKQAHVQADKRVVAQMLKASQDAKAMEAKTSPLLWNLPLDGVDLPPLPKSPISQRATRLSSMPSGPSEQVTLAV